MKYSLLILFLSLSSVLQAQTLNEQIYQAYITGRMDLWLQTMEEMERRWGKSGDYDQLYDLTVAQYGYIAYCMSVKDKRTAQRYIDKAEDNIQTMLRYNNRWAGAHALLGAVYGFKVGQEPIRAPVLGRRSFDENAIAMQLDPNNPQVWMERGNIELYKPAIFGGNKREAVSMYLQAIALYEKDPEGLKNNWLYLNALSGLATAYVKTGQTGEADRTYRKILQVEPRFRWIRDEVYPAFQESLRSN